MSFNDKSGKSCIKKTSIDIAWDKFSDYIGEHHLQTPLTCEEFERIFLLLDNDSQLLSSKSEILYSFQHDCYSWPLVEKHKNTRE